MFKLSERHAAHRGLDGGLSQLRLPNTTLGQQVCAPAAHKVRAVDVQLPRLAKQESGLGSGSSKGQNRGSA